MPAVTALASALAVGVLSYAGYVVATCYRYGRIAQREPDGTESGRLLDSFMPEYEVEEHHVVKVMAPAAVTYEAARDLDINRSRLVRAIFAVRTLPSRLRGRAIQREPRSLVEETLALGWRVLAEVPGRALLIAAVTRPWESSPVFRGLSPGDFTDFSEPGYAKIIWTLEAEPLGPARSRFRTQTRVCTTDPIARARFRRYWAVFSPGIVLIRRRSLGLVKAAAERRFQAAQRFATPRPAPSTPPGSPPLHSGRKGD